jgi:polyisoprenoid-binding protein YceI
MHQPLIDDRIAAAPGGEAPLLLPTGRWTVDRESSGVLFVAHQMGLFKVRGRFNNFDATLDVGPTLADLDVAAIVDLSSVDTDNARRDAHLRSRHYFDVEQHPTMAFRSTAVGDDDDAYWLGGDVTIGDVQRPVMLDVAFNGLAQSRVDRSLRASFVATGQVRRRDFGLDAAKFVVANKIEFELDMQFVACGEPRIEEAS